MKSRYKRIVIKIGSNVLTSAKKGLDLDRICLIAEQVKTIMNRGLEVVIVSSGAISAGVKTLGLEKKPNAIEMKQACASVGQVGLMNAYREAFVKHGINVGQILLTQEDIQDRNRYLNARHTINKLLEMGVAPVINENDTVSFEEIKFGDNDSLSGHVANLVMADMLLILSDIDGFYDKDPNVNKDARRIKQVAKIDDNIEKSAGGTRSSVGIGGMFTKIQAAKKLVSCGIEVVIANGKRDGVILDAVAGKDAGTLFLAGGDKMSCRKRWIAFSVQPSGELFVDEGAMTALKTGKKSLLPSGVKRIDGDFKAGDIVRISGEKGGEFSRGVVNYSRVEVAKIMGKKTSEIEKILGYKYSDEIINRDDLVITEERL